MASAVADVVSTTADALTPVGVIELPIELHVRAAESHLFAVDAREIGLSADAGTEAHVECVIPNVQLPHIGRVDRRYEIHGRHRLPVGTWYFVRHVHDVLVRADA